MGKPTAGRNESSANLIRSTCDGRARGSATRLRALLLLWAASVVSWAGCGGSQATVDPAPFQAALTQYLAKNDMALRTKEIRQGPTVDGDLATMSASMTHRDLGGPSVVWEIQFRREANGQWTVIGHHD